MQADYKVNIDDVVFDSDKEVLDYFVSINGVQMDNPLRVHLCDEDLENIKTMLLLIFEENKHALSFYKEVEDE